MRKPTVVERAYEIARTKGFVTMHDLEKVLRAEGYDDVRRHLRSYALRRALRLIRDDTPGDAPRAAVARLGVEGDD